MSGATDNSADSVHLAEAAPRLKGNMGVAELTMSVLAFSAPLMTVSGFIPVLLMYSGSKSPIIYLICTLILLIFSVGFTKMGLQMQRPGGFYSFITEGLGRSAGLGGAFLAMISYPIVGFVGPCYFAVIFKDYVETNFYGPVIPWSVYALGYILFISALAFRKVDLSARILTGIMILECIITVVFDIASFVNGGTSYTGNASIGIPWITDQNFGLALLFAASTFIGFEATVIYREEVRNPLKTIPMATFIAVFGIGVFYGIAAWAYIAFFGVNNVQEAATADLSNLFIGVMKYFFGKVAVDIVTIVILTSTMASTLSIQNVSARYFHSLGTDRVLPAFLGKVHHRHHSPYIASSLVGGIYTIAVIFFAIFDADPTMVYVRASGIGTFGVLLIMLLASIAIAAYFRKNKASEAKTAGFLWNTLIAPVISTIGIGIFMYLAIANYSDLIGDTGVIAIVFILTTFALPVVGFIYARILRVKGPDIYQRIGRQQL